MTRAGGPQHLRATGTAECTPEPVTWAGHTERGAQAVAHKQEKVMGLDVSALRSRGPSDGGIQVSAGNPVLVQRDMPTRTLVILPTYNEAGNLAGLVERVHRAVPRGDVLVVDDDSPDGTGRLADALDEADQRVRVLHRTRRGGLGAAYVDAFRWALEHGYDRVAQMDADGSHPPELLPDLLRAADDADVVLGSRYVDGGHIEQWSWSRRTLSRLANGYSRRMLGVPLRDMTGGFRVFHRHVLATLPLTEVQSQGYCFQVDIAWRAWQSGYCIREVPITFTERYLGTSKMSGTIVTEALRRITVWGLRERRRRK